MNLFIVIMRFFIGMIVAISNGFTSFINFLIDRHNQKVVKENNRIKRGVVEAAQQSCDEVFSDGCFRNSIISGSEPFVRAKLIAAAVKNSDASCLPTIIIHSSNQYIETEIKSLLGNSVITINRANAYFDPFNYQNPDTIINTILSTLKEKYNANDNIKYCIRGIVKCLVAAGRTPSFMAFKKCPRVRVLNSKVDNLLSQGAISDTVADDIKYELGKGQDEFDKLESYFSDLSDQMSDISNFSSGNNSYDVFKAANSQRILIIDIGSSENDLLIDIIINQIKTFCRHNRVSVIFDDITVYQNNTPLKKFLCDNNKKCYTMFSSSDIYASLCGDGQLFNTIVGLSQKNLIMQHHSAQSAEVWSKTIGYYDKTESNITYTRGKTRGGISLFPSYNTNEAVSYTEKREEIVKGKEITDMQNNELYVYDRLLQNQLTHTYIL